MDTRDAAGDTSCCPRIMAKAKVSTVGTKRSTFQVPSTASELGRKREGTSTPSVDLEGGGSGSLRPHGGAQRVVERQEV